jgi:hypothetical protein
VHRDYHAGMQMNPLLSPSIRFTPVTESSRLGNGERGLTSTFPGHDVDRLRLSALVLVTLVALFAGYVLGLAGGQPSNGARVGWPPPPTNPRSFNP